MSTAIFVVALAIAIILVLASRKPTTQTFQRRQTIDASSEVVYAHIGSLRAYNEWNPWAADEPEQVVVFGGEDGAIGSTMSWEGRKTGQGTMTLSESNGTDMVRYDLSFLKPMKGSGSARVCLQKKDQVVEAVWDIDIAQNFVARIMAVFMNFEKMMGPYYERGLTKLKELSEAEVRKT